jgi:hypothetical protein
LRGDEILRCIWAHFLGEIIISGFCEAARDPAAAVNAETDVRGVVCVPQGLELLVDWMLRRIVGALEESLDVLF